MKVSYGLVINQTPYLKLTKSILQSIEMLQLSEADLVSYLQETVSNNPFLMLTQPKYTSDYNRRTRTRTSLQQHDPLAFVPQRPSTLQDTVIHQLRLLSISESIHKIAIFLAGNINESGYLDISVEETALLLNQTVSDVQHTLMIVQSLEPAGIAARNLTECLSLQVERNPQAPPFTKEILQRYLPELSKSQWQKITNETNLPVDDLKQILAYIQTLEPRPGISFPESTPIYVIADAILIKEGKHYDVRLNDETMPNLSIQPEYKNALRFQDDPVAFAYYQSMHDDAREVIRNFKKRNVTLLRVIDAIFIEQENFIENGPPGIKSLNMKAISEIVGLHLSTVSRAVKNKYVQTPWGLFALKTFFANKISSQHEPEGSDQQVKLRIKEIIRGENKLKPYSDQKIVEELNAEGFLISRRTVAKYRDNLNILSAIYRRKV